jgi:hypothetical protein
MAPEIRVQLIIPSEFLTGVNNIMLKMALLT